jgi:glycosyltransferase involved in cell wall biosynthesis
VSSHNNCISRSNPTVYPPPVPRTISLLRCVGDRIIQMSRPLVSFVVPCYKLGHVLSECIDSILSQTYTDFEVLIMDDCSPDNTSEVARSFGDRRVKHIRNEQNRGHLRNYNRGLCMSRGKYVWLISADDYLRVPYVLARYVQLMERHDRVGYIFCPGIAVKSGRETGLLDYSIHGQHDVIMNGRAFLPTLLRYNGVIAASAMARRDCYSKAGLFPLEPGMAWSGDWYLWCAFTLYFDVAYLAEPMVCYRDHDLSMTWALTGEEKLRTCSAGDLAVRWMIKHRADELGLRAVARQCQVALAQEYATQYTVKEYRSVNRVMLSRMSIDEIYRSVCRNTADNKERQWIRARTFSEIADIFYMRHNTRYAKRFYWSSLRIHPLSGRVHIKLALLSLGKIGTYVRLLGRRVRRCATQAFAGLQAARRAE